MGINDDTVVDLETGRRRQLGIWYDPDPGDYQVSGYRVSATRSHRVRPRIPLDRLERGRQHEMHAVCRVFCLEEFGHGGRHDTIHHSVRHFHDAYVVPESPRHGCNFQADVTGPDNDDVSGGGQISANAGHVIDAAQIVQPVQVATRHVDVPDARACRENQRIVGNALACRGDYMLPVAINGGDSRVQPDVNVGSCVEVRRFEIETLCRQLPCQELLGKRRALVGQPGILAGEHDVAGEAFLPERRYDLSGGVTRSGNYELVRQELLLFQTVQTGCSGQKTGNNIITAMNTTMVSGTPTLR